MPELPEVETYRRLAERALERSIDEVVAPDAWYLKRGLTGRAAAAALTGRRFIAARRRGKTLYLDSSDDGPVLKLGFGMSGRLVVDGVTGIDRLLGEGDGDGPEPRAARAPSSAREAALEPWDRFAIRFEDGGDLRMRDARRLGRVELDADESRLGPDAVGLTPAALRAVLGTSTAPLKARLMDQSRLAGVGNLIADELLWRAGLDPDRAAGSLDARELRRLHRHLVATLAHVLARGSHTGTLIPERRPGGVCPKDGTPLVRRTIGGRTTWSCPEHQR
jgi:formamidopyrimidine-DNA glycosylase